MLKKTQRIHDNSGETWCVFISQVKISDRKNDMYDYLVIQKHITEYKYDMYGMFIYTFNCIYLYVPTYL